MIDFSNINEQPPAKGKLLLAEPLLLDPFFKRSVVLLCEHNEDGSLGFILNKYVDLPVDEVVEGLPQFEGQISLGGPVEKDNLFYLHQHGADVEGSHEIIPGLHMGGNYEDIKSLILAGKASAKTLRFFIGYSGWSTQQLDEEMNENSWIVGNLKDIPTLMRTDIDDLWERTLKSMGGKFEMLTHFPEDPSLN